MDMGKVIGFSFSWLFKKESLKYVLLIWSIALLSYLLFAGAFFLAFGNIISSFLQDQLSFVAMLSLSPETLLTELFSAIALFAVLAVALFVIFFFVGLYVRVLIFFFAFRSARLSYASFSFGRLWDYFVLLIAEEFLVCFSWIHKKAWVLVVLWIAAVLLFALGIIFPLLLFVAIPFILLLVLFFILYPLYLFFGSNDNPNVLVTHRYLLLLPSIFAALAIFQIAAFLIHPLLGLLFVFLFFLLLFFYLCAGFYNLFRAIFSIPVFLHKGSSIFDSLKSSLALTNGKVLDIFIVFLVGGIVGLIVFGVVSIAAQIVLTLLFLGIIPANMWGLEPFLTAAFANEISLTALLFAPQDQIRFQLAEYIAQTIVSFVLAPLSALFYSFLLVGVYLNVISPERLNKKE